MYVRTDYFSVSGHAQIQHHLRCRNICNWCGWAKCNWFVSVLQEAFFGKALLDKSKQTKLTMETGLVDEEANRSNPKSHKSSFLDSLSDPLLCTTSTPVSSKAGPLRMFTYIFMWSPQNLLIHLYICPHVYICSRNRTFFGKYTHSHKEREKERVLPKCL